MPATGSRTSSSVTSTSSTSGPWARPRRRSLRSRKRSLREELSRLSCWPWRSPRSLRSRRLRRFRRLPPSESSLSRVLSRVSRVVAGVAAASSRPPRVRVFSRRWPSSLPLLALFGCAVRAVRCAVRRCSVALLALFGALLGGGLFGLGLDGVLAGGLGGLGCGFAAAAVAGARLARAVAAFGPGNGSAGFGSGGPAPESVETAGASAGAAAGASAAGAVTTPSLPARRLRPRRARGLSWAAGVLGGGRRCGRSCRGRCVGHSAVVARLFGSAGRSLAYRSACAVGGNGRDQITLAHAGTAGNPQLAGKGLELGELEACKAAALGGCCR